MRKIKVENQQIIGKFEDLGALEGSLEDAMMLIGRRRKEAWEMLRGEYPGVNLQSSRYNPETHELFIVHEEDEDEEVK